MPNFKPHMFYSKEPVFVRLHILGRALLCPFSALVPYFPPSAEILDVGCGYGFLLHLLEHDNSNKGRKFLGIDHDLKKINIAKKYASADMEFSQGSIEELPLGRFDVVTITDVLYCISLDKWKGFLDHCFRVLKENGLLVIKEVIKKSGWRHLIVALEEKLAVEVFKITCGDRPHLESIEVFRGMLEKSGFRISEIKLLNRGYTADHCIFIAYKG